MAEVWNFLDGVRWRTAYKYVENFARDASQTQIWIETDWDDANLFRRAALGYSTWDGTAKYLNRRLPLANPYTGAKIGTAITSKQYLDRLDLELFYPDKPDGSHVYPDPTADNWLYVEGRIHYRATFKPVPWDVLSDAAAGATGAYNPASATRTPPESTRFLKLTRRYKPEARKTPSAGFECYDPLNSFTAFVIQEVGMIPTYEVEVVAELIGWPINAYPDTGIAACIGTVNAKTVTLMGKGFAAGTLLYKGPAREIEPYDDAAGFKSVDVPHLFGYRPQKWNYHRLNDSRWFPIRVRGTAASPVPMFADGDHAKLFEPG
jgi:hypothetical protein